MSGVDLANVELIPRLPDGFDPARGNEVPARLIGSTILRIGTAPAECKLEGGGLLIDYTTPDGAAFRVVFEFNELGLWETAHMPLGRSSTQA